MIGDLIARVEALTQLIRRGSTVNVNDQETKDRCIELAKQYFEAVRPEIVKASGETEGVLRLDQELQRLIRLAHGNNARKSYRASLSALRKDLAELNIQLLTVHSPHLTDERSSARRTSEETLILDTLQKLVPSAAASYQQGLADLRGSARTSYRGTAAEFRETLRETVDHLAPDQQVTKQEGFKFEGDLKKPTTKQKVRYLLTSRDRNKTQRAATEKSISLIEELTGEVTRAVYDHASLATHIQQSKREVEQIKRYVDTVLFDLLEIAQ